MLEAKQEVKGLRYVTEDDIPHIVEIEKAAADGAALLGRKGIVEIVKRRRDDEKGTYDTRTMAIEGAGPGGIVGVFAYELQPDGYELLYLFVLPEWLKPEILKLVSIYLKGKTESSATRNSVAVYLRDRDGTYLRTLLPFWKNEGFQISLVPDYFGSVDAWKATFVKDEG